MDDEAWESADLTEIRIENLLKENARLTEKVARCVEALEPFIRRHCGLCVPVDEQGRMGEVTTESCVCDADQKQARAALAAAKGE